MQPSKIIKPALPDKPKIIQKPTWPETIEMTLPPDINPTVAVGLQTWPLKNKIITTDNVKKTVAEVKTEEVKSVVKKNSTFIEEVALEEKRLLNALKNGDVLNEEVPPSLKSKSETLGGAVKFGGFRNNIRRQEQVPHPELTSVQRMHVRQSASNPIRPFLTRGSVAERVLIFERCPSDILLDKRVRTPHIQVPKSQVNSLY